MSNEPIKPLLVAMHSLPSEDYHAIDALSASGLKRLRRAPWAYKAPLMPNAPHPKPSDQMTNGTAVHCKVLEPGQFNERYAIGPEVVRTTKAWKEFAQRHEGLICLKPSEHEAIERQAAAVLAEEDIANLLSHGIPEVSCIWTEQVHVYMDDGSTVIVDVPCKLRADWVHPVGTEDKPGVILMDLKTGQNMSDEGFATACARYGYDLQAAWYAHGYHKVTGVPVHAVVFACVESEFPHLTASYLIADEWLSEAMTACDELLTLYARCALADDWPGYPKGTRYLRKPTWHVLSLA